MNETKSYLNLIKEKIMRIFPSAKNVKIKTSRTPIGDFETKIELIGPNINFVAKKKEAKYRKSVDKSYHAILRQIHKKKSQRKRRKHQNDPFEYAA